MKQNAILRARTILQCDPLFFDTETTGFRSNAEIVEIGVVDAEGQTVLESLVRPTRRIPADATAVHGITDEMVVDAPKWPEIWPQVRQLFADRSVGIFNADFDLRMMRQSHEQHGLTWEAMGGERVLRDEDVCAILWRVAESGELQMAEPSEGGPAVRNLLA